MSRLRQLQLSVNETLKGLARPIARDGFSGLKAGFGNLIMPAARRNDRDSHGYGSGMYSGAYQAMAAAFKEIPGSPTGLALAAETSDVIYNCLTVRCNAIAGLEWNIYPKKGKRDSNTKVENTPFHRLHQYAHTEYDQNLFYLWELSLAVHGETYFEKLPLMGGLPGGLRYLNRIALEPFIAGGRVQYYTYSDDAGMTNFLPHQLVRHGITNLLDDFAGSAPVSRALESLNIDRGLKKHLRAYFRNGAKIGGWLTLRQGAMISPDELKTLKTEFREHLAGADNAYKWGLLPAELEAQSSQNQPFEGFEQLEDSDVQRMHWAMQVSPVLTGAIAASDPLSSLGTLDAAKAFFFESFVEPRSKSIKQVVDEDILPWLWMEDYELVFEVDKVLSTMRQTKEKSDKAQTEFKSLGISHGEFRQQLGYDPDPALADLYWYDGVGLVPKAEVPNLWKLKLPAQPMPNAAGLNSGVQPTAAAPPAAVNPAPPVAGKSMALALTMPNHPDLISLQKRVQSYIGDAPVKWNAPDSFHMTLVFAPAVTDEQFAAVKAAMQNMELPELKLNIGSLNAFENVGEHAIHFRIRQNGDLRMLQQQLYDACKSAGIAMSSFSQPLMYTPHITMGYATQKPAPVKFVSKLAVTPDALELWGDEGSVLASLHFDEDGELELVIDDDNELLPAGKAVHDHDHIQQPAPQTDALDELRAWKKKIDSARRAGKSLAAVKFQNYLIRDTIADGVRLALVDVTDDEAVKAVFERAQELVSIKAIQATRIDFEDEFDDLLARARNDEATRQQFRSKLAALLNKYGKMAFMDGLTDGGIDEPELDQEDKDTIAGMLADQSQYVSGITDVLFKGDGVSDAAAEFKPAMWFNKSINPMYQAGLVSADKNGLYEWVYGDTEHCQDCLKLNGQRHRLKEYDQRGWLPQSDKLDCKGFNCKCKLVKVAGRARGTWPAAA